ncbi:hypothetical protein F441_12572 [Phytophthora nicotianae CJ01A1]|uniref:Uncharacterized protein n=4 Tax=Phytophthora nicotianae TaxID=4792 RepID=V9EUR5_PHYNI|nr:hypothetical protein F443_12606 [Phytophthora nicotianae P1569]ETK82245.1 hypothetical protein L915_12339 [Phytophthora nicotianae]ETL35640.1 hypothetical protein L916_12254 [Phytophthora nicotianae]ETP11971.1 hypothetical protein F441_12572 [Phytophthora nicotianae CJ01A1]ETP40089.1 hypothetical protein F442_12524 [Phytophthora nicotianae P10297]
MRAPRHRNSTRDREKAELSTLRGLAAELEVHLAALRLGEQPQKGSRTAWQCFSERQARARQAAERTNRFLNDRVQSNADWIQRLWELLHEKRRAGEASSLRQIAAMQQKVEDDLVLNQLKKRAESAIPQLPNVFATNGIRSLDGSLATAGHDSNRDLWSHVQTGDCRSTLVCVRRVPFDVHSTSAAIWTTLSCPDKSFASENTGHSLTPVVRVLERTPNACAMKFQGGFYKKSGEFAALNYRAVVRRAELPDHHNTNVFIWQSFFKLANGNIKHQDAMWLTVARCPSGGLESLVTLVCQSQIEMAAGENDASDLLVAIMSVIDICIESILSSADNILFEESLSKSLRSSHKNGKSSVAIDV